jgi:hypothetical protein
MSYGIESKKLKRLVDYYSPYNNGEEIKYLTLLNGEEGLLRCKVIPYERFINESISRH